LLDDVGGGFGLALEAFRAAARSADGRAPETRLLPSALAFLGLSEPNEMLARLYVDPWTPDEMARFAPAVIRCAADGDATADRILREGAAALAGLVAGAAWALNFPGGPEVVVLGGCARSGAPYQPLVESAIAAACPGARILSPEHSTTHGAALNALRAAGIEPLPALTIE
jgi:N-acetylglucosamine kinase-like BadF-type ATPase